MKKYLILLSLILSPSIVSALNLGQIRTEVRFRVKDISATRQRYSDTQINNLINRAHKDVVNYTWVIKKSTDIELVSGATYYTMPTDFINFHRVTRVYRNIYETTLQKLDSDFGNSAWNLTPGIPSAYFQDPSQSNKIGIYPWPNNSSSTGTVRIIYFAQANTLTNDTDIPFNSEDRYVQFHDILISRVCYEISLLEGLSDKAIGYKAEFEMLVQMMMGSLGLKPNYVPSFSSDRGPGTR